MNARVLIASLLISVISLWVVVRLTARAIWFATGRPGTATPADASLAYEEHWISHNGRNLQAWLVRAHDQTGARSAVLIFQGGNRVISEMVHLQRYLYDHQISSMVFDFGGTGNSKGRVNRDAVRDDGTAAILKLQELVEDGTRVFLCAFSRSAGRALAAVSENNVEVNGVILIGAYTTTRDVMLHHVRFVPRKLGAWLFPEYWDNLKAIQGVHCPVLMVHSAADEVVPVAQSRELCAAEKISARLVVIDGLKHDNSAHPLHEEYWEPAFAFMERGV